jgi:mono/diheme cytochrome c family protein
MLLLALLIIITGHLGGSLTHGSNYLTSAFSSGADSGSSVPIKPIANVQEAVLYSDVIKPVLQTKCYSCHGANKQKGKLRLDEQNFIIKGGKNGEIIIAGKTDESEIIKRILLPKEDEDHMPPKEKAQLSKNDIDLIHWWVSSGADFNKKIKELPQTDKIKPALLALQSLPVKEENKITDVPLKQVAKASDSALKKLKALGVMVIPVAQSSNYLSANFITAIFTDKDLQLLEQIKEQLIWLKLGNTKITDAGLIYISKLKNLTKLYVENTAVTDNGLNSLKNLQQLQYLNLTATKVTAKGITQLKELKNLQQIYLYKTGVNGADYFNLKKLFPQTVIDTGGYKLEMLATDTKLVKPPKPKK